VRTDTDIIFWIVAWGRPTVRGEIGDDAHKAQVYRVLRACTFAGSLGQSDSCSVFFDSLRKDARLPAMSHDLELTARGQSNAGRFQSSLTLVDKTSGAPRFDMSFVATKMELARAEPSVTQATLALDAALSGLVALGARADLSSWTRYFAGALSMLREGALDGQRFPPSASIDLVRLARASMQADAFGGMGSWNDFAPLQDDAHERERANFSSALYDAMRSGLSVAANAM
jgi:hypothetical protein